MRPQAGAQKAPRTPWGDPTYRIWNNVTGTLARDRRKPDKGTDEGGSGGIRAADHRPDRGSRSDTGEGANGLRAGSTPAVWFETGYAPRTTERRYSCGRKMGVCLRLPAKPPRSHPFAGRGGPEPATILRIIGPHGVASPAACQVHESCHNHNYQIAEGTRSARDFGPRDPTCGSFHGWRSHVGAGIQQWLGDPVPVEQHLVVETATFATSVPKGDDHFGTTERSRIERFTRLGPISRLPSNRRAGIHSPDGFIHEAQVRHSKRVWATACPTSSQVAAKKKGRAQKR